MKTLVTGASGHLGANTVRLLVAEGHDVRALVRATSDLRALQGLDVDVVTGDLLDADSLRRACDDREWVFHTAAVHRNFSLEEERDIVRPNVEGTRNAVRAAHAAGVTRFIHTSSNATVGYAPHGVSPYDETHYMRDATCPYIRSKCESEALALEEAKTLGLPLVVVCPTAIMGPWDVKLTPGTRALRDMANGGPAVIDFCLSHAEDMARGLLLAAEKGVPGQRYLLGGENLSKERTAEIMSALLGQKRRAVNVPMFALRAIAFFEEFKARRSGGDAGLTQAQLRDVKGATLFYDCGKARRDLGFEPRDGEATLTEAVRWMKHLGLLSPKVVASIGDRLPPDPTWPSMA